MAEQDIMEKTLESYNDVFSDIVNVLLFGGAQRVKEEELETALPRSYYKAEGKIREQERDTSKYWKRINLRISMFGMENETEQEDDMPLRVIGYDGASYRDQLSYVTGPEGKRCKNDAPRYPVITLVLYFGSKHWEKPLTLHESLDIPEDLLPYVSDYRINLFEIAWLPEEQIAKFKSDFRIVADYFAQLRRNGDYIPTTQQITHVREVLHMMSALTNDHRFEDVQDLWTEGAEPKTMSEVIDRCMNKGREEGRREGRKEGREEGIVSSLRNLMETWDLTIEQAMNALKISAAEREKFAGMVGK